MTAMFGILFFVSILAVSGWTIAATVRPRLARIAFLLRYGSVIAPALPQPRLTLRGRPVPMRVTLPPRLRAAA